MRSLKRQRGFLEALIPFAPIIASAASFIGGERRNASARAQALQQMQFQQSMSDTAHQREVNDLRAAGLNPILSGTGGAGASTPSGASAPIEDSITPAISTAMQMRRNQAEVASMEQSVKESEAREVNFKQDTANKVAQIPVLGAQAHLMAEQALRERAQNMLYAGQLRTERNRESQMFYEAVRSYINAGADMSTAKSLKFRADIDETEFARVLEWVRRGGEAAGALTGPARQLLTPMPGDNRRLPRIK